MNLRVILCTVVIASVVGVACTDEQATSSSTSGISRDAQGGSQSAHDFWQVVEDSPERTNATEIPRNEYRTLLISTRELAQTGYECSERPDSLVCQSGPLVVSLKKKEYSVLLWSDEKTAKERFATICRGSLIAARRDAWIPQLDAAIDILHATLFHSQTLGTIAALRHKESGWALQMSIMDRVSAAQFANAIGSEEMRRYGELTKEHWLYTLTPVQE